MDMNLKQIKYVLVLAEEGSFAKAADVLGISQPSLSQYIKKIEKQVGMELFDRIGGEVRLTDAGRVYAEAGKKILDLEHQMQNDFSDIADHKKGSVIVGTSPYRSAAMMPKVVKEFQKLHPGMYITVKEMISDELLEATERGTLDLCLTMKPGNKKDFTIERITEEELVLAVPSGFPKLNAKKTAGKKYPAVDIKETDGKKFVMITESQAMQKTLDDLCSEYGISIEKAAVVKSLEAQIAMVREGVGVALVPMGIETFCSPKEVTFYSIKQNLPKREVVALWRKDRKPNKAAGDLLKIIKKIYS